jgi:hypothetical protein
MTTSSSIADEAESFLRNWIAELTQLREGECLCCYVARLLDESPCDGSLRHALRYRDLAAPRATALDKRLGQIGGYCDCEIFLNGYQLLGSDEYAEDEPDVDDEDVDEPAYLAVVAALEPTSSAEPLPACQGVRRGSVKPCGNWVRIRRW